MRQAVADNVSTCPTCGAETAAGRSAIDDFHILEVLHEGYSSVLCKARREDDETPVLIRIFTPPSGVDEQLADRLKHELEKIQDLPETYFVRHLAIKQSADGLWYRISEWIDALNWGTLLSTGRLKDPKVWLRLFRQVASIIEGLHRIGHIIPHLNLDDILVYEDDAGELQVKIDFKLSRFLDPQLERPRPMLARVLSLHLDILNQRPLDYRSDIWSLGKSFVEILSADPAVEDLQAKVDTLWIPEDIRTLIRLMLSDNPELRPHSMEEVAAALAQVDDKAVRAVAAAHEVAPGETPRTLRQHMNIRLGVLAAIVALIIATGGSLLWYHLRVKRPDIESTLMGFANRYAGSIAFVVVEYWLQQGDTKVYRKRSERTAFLAGERGYLLTNRHVACPWLMDRDLMAAIGLLQLRQEEFRFDYRIYLCGSMGSGHLCVCQPFPRARRWKISMSPMRPSVPAGLAGYGSPESLRFR